MDRWMLEKIAASLGETGRPIFKYSKLHNIFNPKLSKDLPKDINCEEVKRYTGTMKSIISTAIKVLSKYDKTEQARTVYHLFYALYELKWIEQGLPPSLAETRMPTHTVFDHNYAAAMTVNMLWPNGNIGGYLVEVDIPGIQRIVNSARKAGDFWAGSWLVSMLAWFTVWPLIWKYGPDIVVKPTLRLNPIYHVTLSRKLIELEKSLGENLPKGEETGQGRTSDEEKRLPSEIFLEEIRKFYGNIIFGWAKDSKIPEQLLLSNPIIPGTIILLLPAEAAKNEDELKDEIKKHFDNAQQCLTQWALTGSITNECGDLAILLEKAQSSGNKFLQMVERIYNDLKDAKVFDDLIQVRINTVNIGTIHECLQNYLARNTVPEKCVNEGMTENNLKKVKVFLEIIKQLIKSKEKSKPSKKEEEEEIPKELKELGWYLTFDLSLAILNTKVQNLSRKSLIIGKPWFIYDATKHIITKPIIDPYSKYVFYKENKGSKTNPPPNIAILKPNEGSVGYIYCSVCGNEPAILHLRRNPGNSNDYDNETKNLLKTLGIINPNDLLKYIKPGEALGPLCLLKRALYYRFKAVYGIPFFDSTEDVAFAWYMKAYGKLEQSTQARGVCERFYNYLNSDGKDITILCGDDPKCTLEKARREFDECADKILSNHINEFLNMLTTDIRIMNKYNLDKLRPDPSIIHYRSYYAIIRGDADNIGKLSKGEIDLSNYVSLLEQLKQSSDPVTPVGAYSRLIDIINGLIKEKVGLVVTPTYYAALSMALMVTTLKDMLAANFKYYITFKYYTTPIIGLIFSGGDDILALAPTEVATSIVKDLRSNYWGDEDGFHVISNYYVAVPRAYGFGRSLSLRLANIMDVMSEEVREAVELLDGVAKYTTWALNGKELSKDTLVISESRTGKLAVLPLSDPSRNEVLGIPDVLNELFVLRLGGVLSGNVPEDYGWYRDIMETLINSCNKQMMNDVWNHVIWRNTKITELRESIKANLSITTLGQVYNIDPCGKTVIKEGEEAADRSGESRGTNIINELVRAYEVLRGYP
ncbi:type III-B CRISPR-associated protein Cas10/Cmr2 [Vulcanisaeta sp. SCGC AB-777_J10]|nr:type III-B CRISPR-associated protein Cas10/Cmr2 [Vulcanisaeta sp. SCGC AB-777_J10]